jgi:hypothetical protein
MEVEWFKHRQQPPRPCASLLARASGGCAAGLRLQHFPFFIFLEILVQHFL